MYGGTTGSSGLALPRLREALGGPPDLILSDMAANTVGHAPHMTVGGIVPAS